jgi:hypothetical protein
MFETPDFHQIARRIAAEAGYGDDGAMTSMIADELRLVWNARGAADLVKVEVSLTNQSAGSTSGPYLKTLDRALHSLDR